MIGYRVERYTKYTLEVVYMIVLRHGLCLAYVADATYKYPSGQTVKNLFSLLIHDTFSYIQAVATGIQVRMIS